MVKVRAVVLWKKARRAQYLAGTLSVPGQVIVEGEIHVHRSSHEDLQRPICVKIPKARANKQVEARITISRAVFAPGK